MIFLLSQYFPLRCENYKFIIIYVDLNFNLHKSTLNWIPLLNLYFFDAFSFIGWFNANSFVLCKVHFF